MAGSSALKRPGSLPIPSESGGSSARKGKDSAFRFGLQAKLILPYLILSLVLALVVVFVVARWVSGSARQGFNGQLQAVQDSAADSLARIEASQLDSLRLLVFTQGLPEAMASGDADAVVDLVTPLALNAGLPIVTVVDRTGHEVATLTLQPDKTSYVRTSGGDLSQVAIVQRVLQGQQDSTGDKFADVLSIQGRRLLFTSAPMLTADGTRVGVLLSGQDFDQVLLEVARVARADALVASSYAGEPIGMVLPTGVSELPSAPSAGAIASAIQADPARSVLSEVDLAGTPYVFSSAPLRLRGEAIGVLSVGLSAADLRRQEFELQLVLAGVFGLGTLAVLAVGFVMARSIVGRVARLRDMAGAVAEGDLNQRLALPENDEIAELAQAFSEMTERLAERTSEADRLHTETAERARQLEDTNQRLRQAQQQLVQSEKLASIGQLTAGIVHDVKNPLAVIKGIAELIQIEDPALSAFSREQVGLIRDNASHANAIVSDLLTFARQSTPKWQRQDLRDTVQAALRLTEYLLRQAGVQPEADLPAEPVMTVYDNRQIEQVLINLIQNAVQAMPSGGVLRIGLTVADERALLTVADTGVGISPESIGRVFDPFYTTKSEGDGTGLGLSVTYGIISQHGGEIWASSERDRGTTFSIRLPIRQTAPEQPA